MKRCILVLFGLMVAACPIGGAWGQADGRLRHEYVPPEVLSRFDPGRAESAIIGSRDGLPEAIRRDGAQLEQPGPPGSDSPLVRPPDAPPPADSPSIPRPDEARPDRDTGADSNLKYHVIYNPSVAPLRRNVAFDVVEDDYRLTIAPSSRTRVPIVGDRRARPGRELFWGDLKVDFAGEDAPLPSVAPDMRILALRTEPAGVRIDLVKDAADNFYVRAPNHRGEVRLVFLVDADQAYFSSPVPGNVLLGHLSGDPMTALPERARRAGRRVLGELGIGPEMPFDQGVDALVSHFRGFEAGPPPTASGDIYEDLALGGVGVCRHRSFAFMITARAAGVPTRVVHNEAHAFVEVMAPDGRWRRVDLGGEAPELSIDGGEGRRLHQPTPDAFPKPESWRNQYSSMLTNGTPPAASTPEAGDPPAIEGAPPGLGPSADVPAEGAGDGAGPADQDGPLDGAGDGDGDGAGDGAGQGFGDDDGPLVDDPFAPPTGPPAEVPLPRIVDGDEASDMPLDELPTGAPVAVRLALDADARLSGYRGEALGEQVTGRVIDPDSGQGVAGVKVQVHLVPVGGGASVPVGQARVTGPDGRFESAITLPPTLRLGRYRLVAATEAGEGRAAARSDMP